MTIMWPRQRDLVIAAVQRLGEARIVDLHREVPACAKNIERWCWKLKREGVFYIKDWDRSGVFERAYPRAVFAMGPGVDKEKPRRLSRAERSRRYRRLKKVRMENGLSRSE